MKLLDNALDAAGWMIDTAVSLNESTRYSRCPAAEQFESVSTRIGAREIVVEDIAENIAPISSQLKLCSASMSLFGVHSASLVPRANLILIGVHYAG